MAGEQSITSGIAGRYATALFELALGARLVDEISADLDSLQDMLEGSADLMRVVRSPLIRAEDQARAIAAIAGQAGFNELTVNFLGVVSANRRLFTLTGIIEQWRALVADLKGEVVAEVTSATNLTDSQQEALQKTLSENLGQTVNLETDVDEDLLAGLVVRIGSRMIDSSLRTKLLRLRAAMKEVG